MGNAEDRLHRAASELRKDLMRVPVPDPPTMGRARWGWAAAAIVAVAAIAAFVFMVIAPGTGDEEAADQSSTSSVAGGSSSTMVATETVEHVDEQLGFSIELPAHWDTAAETLSRPEGEEVSRELLVAGTGPLGEYDSACPTAPVEALASMETTDVLVWLVEWEPIFQPAGTIDTLPSYVADGTLSDCAEANARMARDWEFLRWSEGVRGLWLIVAYGADTTPQDHQDALAVVQSLELFPPQRSCEPDRTTNEPLIGPEAQAASHRDIEVWALFFTKTPLPDGESIRLPAGEQIKVAWAITGAGEISMEAIGPDGFRIAPDWGPDVVGSNWERAGDERHTGWTFPEPGCWTLRIDRGDSTATLDVEVVESTPPS